MSAIRSALALVVFSALLLIAARPAHAQTEIVLYNFCSQPNCVDGKDPAASLAPDGAGNFYGSTQLGGANMDGTVFELSPNGFGGYDETVLYSFCSLPYCTDGSGPTSNVIFDGAGNLYGTACSGGANGQGVASACGDGSNGYGVVYELSPEPAVVAQAAATAVMAGARPSFTASCQPPTARPRSPGSPGTRPVTSMAQLMAEAAEWGRFTSCPRTAKAGGRHL